MFTSTTTYELATSTSAVLDQPIVLMYMFIPFLALMIFLILKLFSLFKW